MPAVMPPAQAPPGGVEARAVRLPADKKVRGVHDHPWSAIAVCGLAELAVCVQVFGVAVSGGSDRSLRDAAQMLVIWGGAVGEAGDAAPPKEAAGPSRGAVDAPAGAAAAAAPAQAAIEVPRFRALAQPPPPPQPPPLPRGAAGDTGGGGGAAMGDGVERAYIRYVAPVADDPRAAGYDLDERDEAWLAARRAKARRPFA